jgi:hypothetical protein
MSNRLVIRMSISTSVVAQVLLIDVETLETPLFIG